MSNMEYIKDLTAGECPDWVCEQIAGELDARDQKLKVMTKVMEEMASCLEDMDEWGVVSKRYQMARNKAIIAYREWKK